MEGICHFPDLKSYEPLHISFARNISHDIQISLHLDDSLEIQVLKKARQKKLNQTKQAQDA